MRRIWKVLIADDEAIIREGIREAVDWSALGMEVAAEAEDGEEALEQAAKHSADIVLVDLNMPIMHGLKLIKLLREKLPDCRVIIITGHDEFAYAQEAIRLGVQEYILKPANPKELTEVLTRVRMDLESAVKQNEHLKLASKQIAKNIPLLRERFGHEWIEGGFAEEEILEQLQFLQLPPFCPDWIGVIRWPELSVSQQLLKENERQLLLFAIENITGELLEGCSKVMFRDYGGLIVLLIWGDMPIAKLQDIEAAVQAYLKLTIHTHFEQTNGELSGVPAIYRRCKANVYKESQISPVVRRAKQHIRENFHDPDLSLEAFAHSMQVSPVYLSRIIKQELGTSFVSLVTMMRVEKAIQLLNATDMPIHEIAEKVGYVTQHYFSTAFKKVMGVSPNQYRKGEAFSEE